MDEHRIAVTVNGTRRESAVEARRTLADFLREDCELTGTHLGCEHGVCGACTVVLDGEAVRSCLLFAVQADGADVVTIEGLGGPDGALSPVQEAFRAEQVEQNLHRPYPCHQRRRCGHFGFAGEGVR